MSDELRRRFESLADVADSRPLSGPAAARQAGRRRTVRRRQSIAFASGIAVAAVAATVFVSLPSGAPSLDSSPSAATEPSAAASPPVSPSTSDDSHPSSPSRSPGANCSASDLDSHAYFRGDGAMGTLSYEITIRNGARRCRLGVPKLEGVNAYTGVREAVPFTPSLRQGRTLAPRAYAEVSVQFGSDPFQPNGSPCVRPPDYKNVALVFPDGSRYALPHVRLTAKCHGFWGGGWSDSQYPQQPGAYQPAAP